VSGPIDFKDRNWECPSCGWRLCRGGFCIHEDEDGAREIFDGVAATITDQEWREAREAAAAVRASRITPEPTEAPSAMVAPQTQMRLSN
jgi:hypothetical protein